jgi:hypothetical protein
MAGTEIVFFKARSTGHKKLSREPDPAKKGTQR